MATLQQKILDLSEQHFETMVKIRRHLHRNPEVSFQEFDTTEFIIGELGEMDIEVERPLETGCLGIIRGNKESERVIALRADIDALPMQEEGEAKKEFISERPGAAHCCGHDGHTANLLGAARILSDLKSELTGTVVLIFQPGEEKLPGGGSLLTETNALQNLGVQEVYGLHTNPRYEPGVIAVKPGPLMACTVEFTIEVIGKGGHAAAPHLAVDPIVAASQAITQFQSIVSRSVDPTESAVITVARIEAGSAFNIIPEKATLYGTVRTFSLEQARFIRKRMDEVLQGITKAAGATYTFDFTEGYPAVINDGSTTEKLKNSAKMMLGDDKVVELDRPSMAGEDFSFYQKEFPGTFFFLGTGSDEADSKWDWHHPRYNIDERGLLTGSRVMAAVALEV